ncbi:MAG: M14 family zinc carboxypeptidase, partial [Pelobium sp.]
MKIGIEITMFKNSLTHQKYRLTQITDRLFTFLEVDELIKKFEDLNWKDLGNSFEGRPIRMVKIGNGETKVMLWSQMHGDEPTATAAIFDLLNFFQSSESLADEILNKLSIYFIPVVNPDGLAVFTRRNAQKIDINRDFLALQSPEANLLKATFNKIKPDFAFNLHDQSSLYCTPSNNPVGISFLAPAADKALTVTWNREQAMKVIVEMNHTLQKLIPNQTARFKDDFEPRAFGDNFQKHCPTILIESGFLKNDEEKQYIRALNFEAIIVGLQSIALKSYQEIDLMNYLMIPIQSQDLFHLKIKNCIQKEEDKNYKVDLGFVYEENFYAETRTLEKKLILTDIGDLSAQHAYEIIDASALVFSGNL